MAVRFVVGNEYVDLVLNRRVLVGEEIELTTERVNAVQALGVKLTPIREKPPDTATAEPDVEKAVNPNGRQRSPKV